MERAVKFVCVGTPSPPSHFGDKFLHMRINLDCYNGKTLMNCDRGDQIRTPEKTKESKAKKKTLKDSTPKKNAFVLTLGLKYNKSIERHLDKMFTTANKVYNALVAEMRQIFESDEYTFIDKRLKELWKIQAESSLSKEEKQEEKMLKERKKQFINEVLPGGKYGVFNRAIKYKLMYGWRSGETRVTSKLLDSVMTRGVCESIWQKVDKFLFHKGKELRFRKLNDCKSIVCNDKGGIEFVGDAIQLPGRGRAQKSRLVIPVQLTGREYERKALENWEERILSRKLIRIPWKKGWLYKVQLTFDGSPPKETNEDGDPKHKLGKGRVGIDINEYCVAVVGEHGAVLHELAKDSYAPWKKLQEIGQRMEKSRRASNPEMYDSDGQYVRADILAKNHPECVKVITKEDGTKRYIRLWKFSKNYLRLSQQWRFLWGRFTRSKENQHKALANLIMSMGNEFYTEKMNWSQLQRRKKFDPDSPNERLKQYGKAHVNKSPGGFAKILKDKIEQNGGVFEEVDTVACKASQYDHSTQTYVKHGVDERTKYVGGELVQRDLYSAFLLQNVNGHKDGFVQEQLEENWERFLKHQDLAMDLVPFDSPPSMGKEEWDRLKRTF